jgi:hypothetical protein
MLNSIYILIPGKEIFSQLQRVVYTDVTSVDETGLWQNANRLQ